MFSCSVHRNHKPIHLLLIMVKNGSKENLSCLTKISGNTYHVETKIKLVIQTNVFGQINNYRYIFLKIYAIDLQKCSIFYFSFSEI